MNSSRHLTLLCDQPIQEPKPLTAMEKLIEKMVDKAMEEETQQATDEGASHCSEEISIEEGRQWLLRSIHEKGPSSQEYEQNHRYGSLRLKCRESEGTDLPTLDDAEVFAKFMNKTTIKQPYIIIRRPKAAVRQQEAAIEQPEVTIRQLKDTIRQPETTISSHSQKPQPLDKSAPIRQPETIQEPQTTISKSLEAFNEFFDPQVSWSYSEITNSQPPQPTKQIPLSPSLAELNEFFVKQPFSHSREPKKLEESDTVRQPEASPKLSPSLEEFNEFFVPQTITWTSKSHNKEPQPEKPENIKINHRKFNEFFVQPPMQESTVGSFVAASTAVIHPVDYYLAPNPRLPRFSKCKGQPGKVLNTYERNVGPLRGDNCLDVGRGRRRKKREPAMVWLVETKIR